MVGPYQEAMSIEEVSELQYAPHNAKAHAFRCGIILLSWAESTAPIENRYSCTVRLLLQQGASELVGASVDINNHLAFGFWQGQDGWCKERLPQVVEGRKGCVSWLW